MKKDSNRIWFILMCIMAASCLLLILAFFLRKPASSAPAPTDTTSSRPEVIYKDKVVEKIVETKKEINATVIQDGLKNMGTLITQEYYYTEVMDYSSVKTIFHGISLPWTETSYVVQYDGTIKAGINFEKITVTKNDETKTITINLPPAEIDSNDIDYDSFRLISEKQSSMNKLSVADFNDSLKELESEAEEKAISRGLLTKATDNAKIVIENFVSKLMDGEEAYEIKIVTR